MICKYMHEEMGIYSILKCMIVVFMLVTTSSTATSAENYTFSPLPMKNTQQLARDFLPFIKYVEKHLAIKLEYKLEQNYEDILHSIIEKRIDFAVLGPLPWLKLNAQYPHLQPIVFFKRSDGRINYKCVLSKFIGHSVDIQKPLKIALTQPLSTCGYYQTSILLQQKYDIKLSQQYYRYTNSHTNAVTSVVLGEFDLAGSSDSYANNYRNMGIEIIAESSSMPGFALYANTETVDQQVIKNLRELMLKIKPSEYAQWSGPMQYGVKQPSGKEFSELSIDLDIPLKGNY